MVDLIETLAKLIKNGLNGVVSTSAFASWLTETKCSDGDIVVVNNSFIYRKPLIKTSKNSQYLALKVKGTRPDPSSAGIIKPDEINSDFKLLSAKSQKLPSLKPLNDSLQAEIKRMGHLVFVLTGYLVASQIVRLSALLGSKSGNGCSIWLEI